MSTRAVCRPCRRLAKLGLDKDLLVGRGLIMDVKSSSLLGETYEAVLGKRKKHDCYFMYRLVIYGRLLMQGHDTTTNSLGFRV
jgi:hypothetical protein